MSFENLTGNENGHYVPVNKPLEPFYNTGQNFLDDLLYWVFFFENCLKKLNSFQWKEEKTSYTLVMKTFKKQIVYEVICLFYDRH